MSPFSFILPIKRSHPIFFFQEHISALPVVPESACKHENIMKDSKYSPGQSFIKHWFHSYLISSYYLPNIMLGTVLCLWITFHFKVFPLRRKFQITIKYKFQKHLLEAILYSKRKRNMKGKRKNYYKIFLKPT